ncbi:MAG: PAS domain-containing protein, partial [Caldilineaceae bacterium]|nr:PAS domain-containing protein [Caldilineaceae bacterium]
MRRWLDLPYTTIILYAVWSALATAGFVSQLLPYYVWQLALCIPLFPVAVFQSAKTRWWVLAALTGDVFAGLSFSSAPIDSSLLPVWLAVSSTVAYIGMHIDNYRARIDAKEADRLFLYRLLDTNPNLVLAKDADGRVVFVNQSALSLYGVNRSDVIGKSDMAFRLTPEQCTTY